MNKAKRYTTQILRYPLMWVMLLWAVTLPGHETVVYSFLINICSGTPAAALIHAGTEIAQSGDEQSAKYVFLDAVPAANAGKLQFLSEIFLPGDFVFYSFVSVAVTIPSVYSLWHGAVQKRLLASVLPNAP